MALPFVDEHRRTLAAGPEAAWEALVRTLERQARARRQSVGARLLGCRETARNALPLDAVGATVPGFAVAEADRPSRLFLAGGHRFSDYALEFELAPAGPGATELTARTRARFPGPAGRAYRALVIGTRGHVVAVRSILAAVARRAER